MKRKVVIGLCLLSMGIGSMVLEASGPQRALAQEPTQVVSRTGLAMIDSDFDGCSDAEELGTNARKGGMRDPNNPLDFFDVNFDRKVNQQDVREVTARLGVKKGDPNYDLAYDRAVVGTDPWDLGPGNGVVGPEDVKAVIAQLRTSCKGVPIKSFASVCSELQTEATSEGFNEFSCSTNTLPALDSTPQVGRKRAVQLSRLPNQTVVVDKFDQEVQVAQATSAVSTGAMTAAVYIPASCYTQVCTATVTRKIELKHLFGYGPNCAWISFRQKWDVYYPWRVIASVSSPAVSSGAWAPCAQDSRSVWLHRDGMPYYADSGASIHWKVGIPSPWGTLGFREFNPWIGLLFRGDYSAQWL